MTIAERHHPETNLFVNCFAPMTEYQREQQAFHANRERLKAGAGDETGPSVTSPVYSQHNTGHVAAPH